MTTGWALIPDPPLDMVRPTPPGKATPPPLEVGSKGCAVITEPHLFRDPAPVSSSFFSFGFIDWVYRR